MAFLRVLLFTLLVVAPDVARAADPTPTRQKTETFDKDPNWDGFQNRIKLPPVRKQQDFGWSKTNHAGKSAGEIGGTVWRCITPAYYAKKIGPFDLDGTFSAAGTMAMKRAKTRFGWQTGSTIWIGFFNHAEQGWRPINFMGFRFETHTDTAAKKLEERPYVEQGYGTAKWTAGGPDWVEGTTPNASAVVDPDGTLRVPADGARHTWELRYEPTGGKHGLGLITYVFDGAAAVRHIDKSIREQGITVDRFGIFNMQLPGQEMEAYFDDITINGQIHDFTDDPKWEAVGNRDLVEDVREYAAQDYGFSATSNAGGKPGEMGGRFISVDPWEKQFQGHYGDRVGRLSLDHKLVARGKLATRTFSIDSTFALGWFSATDRGGWPLKNFVGVAFDSLTDTGRIVQTLYGTTEGSKARSSDYVTFNPDGTSYDWTLEYDPAAAGGNGAITFTINNQKLSIPLAPGDKQKGAVLDRFGVFNLPWANSKYCIVYLDDLTYTVAADAESR
jgi:hypothetical protein